MKIYLDTKNNNQFIVNEDIELLQYMIKNDVDIVDIELRFDDSYYQFNINN